MLFRDFHLIIYVYSYILNFLIYIFILPLSRLPFQGRSGYSFCLNTDTFAIETFASRIINDLFVE